MPAQSRHALGPHSGSTARPPEGGGNEAGPLQAPSRPARTEQPHHLHDCIPDYPGPGTPQPPSCPAATTSPHHGVHQPDSGKSCRTASPSASCPQMLRHLDCHTKDPPLPAHAAHSPGSRRHRKPAHHDTPHTNVWPWAGTPEAPTRQKSQAPPPCDRSATPLQSRTCECPCHGTCPWPSPRTGINHHGLPARTAPQDLSGRLIQNIQQRVKHPVAKGCTDDGTLAIIPIYIPILD
jgi:hypothetical protein